MFICEECKTELKYKSHVAAPGYGKTYICPNCGERYLNIGTNIINWKDVDKDIFENKY